MSKIMINPGAGRVESGTWEQAYENIKQYIKDCEIPMHIVSARFIPCEGRYMFVLDADDFSYRTEVEMPGLPLNNVRYIDEGKQNPFDFPRLYVDGSSWLWKYAVVTKTKIESYVDEEVEELKDRIEGLQGKIEKMNKKI